jgi:hypothetical protein
LISFFLFYFLFWNYYLNFSSVLEVLEYDSFLNRSKH